jgi:Virulence factor membrane-bound polymerase, C-terminal
MLLLVGMLVFCFYKLIPLLGTLSGRVIVFLLVAPLLHHLVEYPLDYLYFLFPWAFLLGAALIKASPSIPKSESGTEVLPFKTISSQNDPALATDLNTHRDNGMGLLPLLLIVAPIFAAYDIKKVLPLYDVKAYAIPHERLTKAYDTVLFTHMADYSALGILPPSPELATVQLSLAKKVSYFRFDDVVASVYARSAALNGEECLAKAIAYKIWLMDKTAFSSFKSDVEKSTFSKMGGLISFNNNPYPVAWSKISATDCH